MNISELVKAVGGAPDFSYVPLTLVCNGIEFKVKIKKQMSVADAEFIFKPKADFEDALSIRRVHRLVLFVSEGVDERPTMEQVSAFPIPLMNVIGQAIEKLHLTPAQEGKLVKKISRRARSSGRS